MREGENPEVGRVTGYRVLSDAELALVNEIKAKGGELEELLNKAHDVIGDDPDRLRALALGKTNLQQGFMWAIRAVANPQGFA